MRGGEDGLRLKRTGPRVDRDVGSEDGLRTGDRGAGARTGSVGWRWFPGRPPVLSSPISEGSCPTQSIEEIQGPRKQVSK